MKSTLDDGTETKNTQFVYRIKRENWNDLVKAFIASSDTTATCNTLQIDIGIKTTKENKTINSGYGLNSGKKTRLTDCYEEIVQNVLSSNRRKAGGKISHGNLRSDLNGLLRRMDILEKQINALHDGITKLNNESDPGFFIASSTETKPENVREFSERETKPILIGLPLEKIPSSYQFPTDGVLQDEMKNVASETRSSQGVLSYEKERDLELYRLNNKKEHNTGSRSHANKMPPKWAEHTKQLQRESSRGSDDSSDFSRGGGKDGLRADVFVVETKLDFPTVFGNYKYLTNGTSEINELKSWKNPLNQMGKEDLSQQKNSLPLFLSDKEIFPLWSGDTNQHHESGNRYKTEGNQLKSKKLVKTEITRPKQGKKRMKYNLSPFSYSDNKNYASSYSVAFTNSVLILSKSQNIIDCKIADIIRKIGTTFQDGNEVVLNKLNVKSNRAIYPLVHKYQDTRIKDRSCGCRSLVKEDSSECKRRAFDESNTDDSLIDQFNSRSKSSYRDGYLPKGICVLEPIPFSSSDVSGSESGELLKPKNGEIQRLPSYQQQSRDVWLADTPFSEIDFNGSLDNSCYSFRLNASDQQLITVSELLNNRTIELITQDLRNLILEQMLDTWEHCLIQINETVENKSIITAKPTV